MTGNTGFFKVVGGPKIKLRTPQFIYAKMLFVYTLLYVLFFAFGCFVYHALPIPTGVSFNERITTYFSVGFSDCDGLLEGTRRLLAYSRQDISNAVIVFTAGFTMLSGLIISGMLAFRGFSMGFSVSYLVYAVRESAVDLAHPYTSVILFSILAAAHAAILIHIGVKTTVFSDEFKALGGRPRKIICSKALYMQIFRFLIALGAVLILNLIRCVL